MERFLAIIKPVVRVFRIEPLSRPGEHTPCIVLSWGMRAMGYVVGLREVRFFRTHPQRGEQGYYHPAQESPCLVLKCVGDGGYVGGLEGKK